MNVRGVKETPLNNLPSWAEDTLCISEGRVAQSKRGTPIPIVERNRATVYATTKADFKLLQKIRDEAYLSKGVEAILVCINGRSRDLRFAVYVEPGFLVE